MPALHYSRTALRTIVERRLCRLALDNARVHRYQRLLWRWHTAGGSMEDPADFILWVEQAEPRLRRWLHGQSFPDYWDTDDFLQQTYVQAWRWFQKNHYCPPWPLTMAICRNVFLTRCRRAARETAWCRVQPLITGCEEPGYTAVEARLSWMELVSPQEMQWIRMYYGEGIPLRAVAESSPLTYSTLKMRLYRLRRRLLHTAQQWNDKVVS